MSDAHLHSAARALERVLAVEFPEHAYVAEVREQDRVHTARDTARLAARVDETGAMLHDTDPVAERRTGAAAAAPANDDGLEQAA